MPVYVDQLQSWWNGVIAFAAERGVTLPELSMNADNGTKVVTDFLTNNGGNMVNTTLGITTSILGALVFSVYLLAQKEKPLAQSKRLLLAAIPQKAGKRTMHILQITNNAFSSFVTGQVTEAFILGTLCCMGMLILRLPYALPAAVTIGGGAFGIAEMLLGVPICSVVYMLVQDFVSSRPAEDDEKPVPPETE